MSELWEENNKVMTIREENGVPAEILKVDEPGLLPFYLKHHCTIERYNEWLKRRSIPNEREGYADLKKYTKAFTCLHHASVSDPFWVRRRYEKWSQVSFYNKIFSPELGNLIFMPYNTSGMSIKSDSSPDLTTNGVLRKCWRQHEDKRPYLVKAGSKKYRHEPLSEVLSSVILEKLDVIPYVRYDLHIEGIEMCSVCDSFIELGQELVPASDFYSDEKRQKSETVYQHLLKMCKKYEIPGAEEYVDKMIFLDSFLGNTDRNLSNIGFIYDVRKGRFLGPAPIYDNGTAFFDGNIIRQESGIKPFSTEEKRIFDKLPKECDFTRIQKDRSYEQLINNYPGISNEVAQRTIEQLGLKAEAYVKGRMFVEKEEKTVIDIHPDDMPDIASVLDDDEPVFEEPDIVVPDSMKHKGRDDDLLL